MLWEMREAGVSFRWKTLVSSEVVRVTLDLRESFGPHICATIGVPVSYLQGLLSEASRVSYERIVSQVAWADFGLELKSLSHVGG